MGSEKPSDFRYNTGPSSVPWAAVGEPIGHRDIMKIVEFLLRPQEEDDSLYQRQLKVVAEEMSKLASVSRPAGKLSLGESVKKVEKICSDYLKCKHACFVTNATAGFEIACRFAGLKAGDEVIAPPITFIATIAYPMAVGARVVFADVDKRTLNMDPADVARKVTKRTKVIIPVHLGGYPADMDPIMEIAEKRNITVIEDAAHAFGARYKGRMAGTIGHFGAYSFHEVKNINSLGEGGVLVSNGPWGDDLPKARFLGLDFSRKIKDWLYDVVALQARDGTPFACPNHSSTEIQAVVLAEQIQRIDEIIARRREVMERLSAAFADVPGLIVPPADTSEIQSTHHLYLLQVDPEKLGGTVQDLKAGLASRGITQIPHFGPLYDFAVMKSLGYDGEAIAKTCPVAEEAFHRRFTHLPLYGLTDRQLDAMVSGVIDTAKEIRRR